MHQDGMGTILLCAHCPNSYAYICLVVLQTVYQSSSNKSIRKCLFISWLEFLPFCLTLLTKIEYALFFGSLEP